MLATPTRSPRTWRRKFGDALRGCGVAVRDQHSLWVHLAFALGVTGAGVIAQLQSWQWCVVCLCITLVLVTEMLNTALEAMAKAVDPDINPHLRDALDMGSAAVLLAAAGAVAVGGIVFLL
ncbi:MAG: diacylglycerol kinase family protein [Pirellulaceae bacterium]